MKIENIRDHGEITKQVITLDANRSENERIARAIIRAIIVLMDRGEDPGALPEAANFFLSLNEAITDGAHIIKAPGRS